MAGSGPLNVAIVGCGNISKGYAKTMAAHPDKIKLIGAFDLKAEATAAICGEFGGKAYGSLDAVLADPAVEAVVNLTIHQAHVEVITRCLQAGKHVHTEKPIALDPADARKLVELAKKRKVRLSSAPITFMGEAQQTAWKLVRDGRLGKIRVVYAEMNWGRIEKWHPNPAPFYAVGALYDVGVYPLTVMTTILGPVKEVNGFGKVVSPNRVTKDGGKFRVTTPDWMCGFLQFASGPVCRLTTSFYVRSKQSGVEFHGDAADMVLSTPHDFNGTIQIAEADSKEWKDVPLIKEPFAGVEWARGITELRDAIRENRPQRATGDQAAHVVEIIAGVHKAAKTGKTVKIKSKFRQPKPMDWAL